jgi:hypothetical protein
VDTIKICWCDFFASINVQLILKKQIFFDVKTTGYPVQNLPYFSGQISWFNKMTGVPCGE